MSEVLRPGLLDGVSVWLDSPDDQLGGVLSTLGAQVRSRGGEAPGPDALIVDCSGWTAPASPGSGADPLLDLLDHVWELTAAAAHGGFIPGGRGGRLLFIAPAEESLFARPATAALENLSRTLSVEWARHSVTAVTLVPSAATELEDLATVVAYLLSPAGAYFSGARLDLGSLSR